MITNEAKQSIIGMRVICYKMHLYVGTHIGDVSMFFKCIPMNIKSLYIFDLTCLVIPILENE